MRKFNFKSFISGILVGSILVFSFTTFAASTIKSAFFNDKIKLFVNGKQVNTEIATITKEGQVNGSNYVAARALAEAMGWTVTWNGNEQSIYVTDATPTPAPTVTPKPTTASKAEVKKLISEPSTFEYNVNSADGITLTLLAKNLSGKTINYYTLKISTYNAVGDPSYDSISGKCVFYQKYVGPVKPEGQIAMFNLFTYQSAIDKIVVDEIEIEFSDGTKETQLYGYSTTDSSGFAAD